MKSDELDEAFSALRAETGGAEPRARATLARVLLTTRRASRRRFRLLKVWLPIAAVLVASTAWAAASGHLDALLPRTPALDPTYQSERPSVVDAEVEPARALYLAPSSVIAAPEPSGSAVTSAPSAASSASEPAAPSPLALDKAAYEAAYRLHAKTSSGDASARNAPTSAARRRWRRSRFEAASAWRTLSSSSSSSSSSS